MRENHRGGWGMLALLNAAFAAWLIHDIGTAIVPPSHTVKLLEYAILAGGLIGLALALFKLMTSSS